MNASLSYTATLSLIVALGGFLMGFDASVISGVVGFIEGEFALSKWQLGWAVSSLTLAATISMLLAGRLSDLWGRRKVLQITALLFAISALLSAWAPTFEWFVIARMIGGLGVGAALIIAPVYIAEISPAQYRGRFVSFNQLNIVVGISAAFFSNYAVLSLVDGSTTMVGLLGLQLEAWRLMLAIETLPAGLFFVALFFVPESPRWLAMRERHQCALEILSKTCGEQEAQKQLADIKPNETTTSIFQALYQLFSPSLRKVLVIGLVIAIVQQATGINAIFFYAPMIFEQTGVATDTAFLQASLVGFVNLVFTVLAMMLIDKLGRRFLLSIGLSGIVISMSVITVGFQQASYQLDEATVSSLSKTNRSIPVNQLSTNVYSSEQDFQSMIEDSLRHHASEELVNDLVKKSIQINVPMILMGILVFVASFAISLGPVMWVLLAEIFPNTIRAIGISLVGLVNSSVSFTVQLIFPWELAVLGSATTFCIYGLVALFGFWFVRKHLPETKQQSLEQLEQILVK